MAKVGEPRRLAVRGVHARLMGPIRSQPLPRARGRSLAKQGGRTAGASEGAFARWWLRQVAAPARSRLDAHSNARSTHPAALAPHRLASGMQLRGSVAPGITARATPSDRELPLPRGVRRVGVGLGSSGFQSATRHPPTAPVSFIVPIWSIMSIQPTPSPRQRLLAAPQVRKSESLLRVGPTVAIRNSCDRVDPYARLQRTGRTVARSSDLADD